MAQKTVVRLVDDLDDTEITDGAGETVTFGVDNVEYEIDLSDKNADELREALSRYVEAARKVGGRSTRTARQGRSAAKDKSLDRANYDTVAVREWAKANKIEVSARGRLPKSVIERFQAAGN